MERSVQSGRPITPVNAPERARDYLTEEEFRCLLLGTRASRYRWPNTAMLLLTFYHGLRASELCRLRRVDVDLPHRRLSIARLMGRHYASSCCLCYRVMCASGCPCRRAEPCSLSIRYTYSTTQCLTMTIQSRFPDMRIPPHAFQS